jgi:catechol 2,3-dioxygenase-like lactoylglutathione lyase family enzyme
MSTEHTDEPNVKQAVPFFGVTDIEESVRYYVDGLGFEVKIEWVPEGRRLWCWLEREGAALMLQEFAPPGDEGHKPEHTRGNLGPGVSICFQCADALALYHEFTSRGIRAERPFVGNRMWVTSLTDPDGYRLFFESPTDAPEETVLPEAEG